MAQNGSKPVNPYLRTKVMTASPAELRMMLLDGAVKFARLGRDGLAAKDYEQSFNSISRAEDIVMELRESLKPEAEPELCRKLNDLYLHIYLQLVRASSEKNIAVLDQVIALLEYECETWRMAMAELNGAGADSARPAEDGEAAKPQAVNGQGPEHADRPSFSAEA